MGYTRVVETIHLDRHLTVFPIVLATSVFQVAWEFLFTQMLGMSFGALRMSTPIMSGLGAAALNGLMGELSVTRRRRALDVAG